MHEKLTFHMQDQLCYLPPSVTLGLGDGSAHPYVANYGELHSSYRSFTANAAAFLSPSTATILAVICAWRACLFFFSQIAAAIRAHTNIAQ